MNGFLRVLRISGWTLLVLMMVSLVLSGVLVGLAHEGLFSPDAGAWHVVVDGEDLGDELWLHGGPGGFLGLVLGLAVALFCVVVVLPITLLLGVGLPLLGVLLALGAVAVALAGMAALLGAPLLLPILFVVWLARRAGRRAPAA